MDFLKEGLLKVEPGLLIWTAVTFLVLVLALWKFAWKAIISGLDSRAERIRAELEDAEAKSAQSKKILDEQKDILDKARKDAQEIMSKAEKAAGEERQKILEQSREEAQKQVESAKNQIELARKDAIAEIKEIVADISIDITKKMIGKSLSEDDHKKFLDDSISKFLS